MASNELSKAWLSEIHQKVKTIDTSGSIACHAGSRAFEVSSISVGPFSSAWTCYLLQRQTWQTTQEATIGSCLFTFARAHAIKYGSTWQASQQSAHYADVCIATAISALQDGSKRGMCDLKQHTKGPHSHNPSFFNHKPYFHLGQMHGDFSHGTGHKLTMGCTAGAGCALESSPRDWLACVSPRACSSGSSKI